MNLDQLIIKTVNAALEAGKEILEVYQSDFDVYTKEDHSPLTLADQKSHQCIERHLIDTGYPILSEEGSATSYEERKNWDYFWMVDPLDGTKEFVKRNGEFTVNIALIKDQEPILGVIYAPVKQSLYFAHKERGAWKTAPLSEETSFHTLDELLEQSLALPQQYKRPYTAIASRSHMSPETREYMDSLEQEHGQVDTLSVGSSLKLCLVAEGKADCYPRFAPTMEWDTAAGDAIARMAGFQVIQYEKNTPLLYNKENLLNPWFIVK